MISNPPITDTIKQAEEFKSNGDSILKEILATERKHKDSENSSQFKDTLNLKYKKCMREYHNANLFLR